MFNLKKSTAVSKNQKIKFDENYCHTAGLQHPLTYRVEKGINEIIFDFGNLDDFWKTYFQNNPHLPKELRQAVNQQNAFFTVQILQDNDVYIFNQDMANTLILNSSTLKCTITNKKFEFFNNGTLAIGIFYGEKHNFGCLWGTMYKTE